MVEELIIMDADPTVEPSQMMVHPAGNFRMSDDGGLQC